VRSVAADAPDLSPSPARRPLGCAEGSSAHLSSSAAGRAVLRPAAVSASGTAE
jgi:hypothetical protein